MQLKEIICDLCSLSAPSGYENKAFERISELLKPYTDEINTDAMGNLIAVKHCGKPNCKKLMLDAHMDEIGFIITGIENGFLRFSNIGGIDPRMLPAKEIKILTEPPIYGVIDTLPPHILEKCDMDKTFDADKLFIDVGMTEEDAKKLIPIGTPAVYATKPTELLNGKICSKTLDDRACVAIIVKVMEYLSKKELDVDLYCLISTQEEVGMRGAVTGAFSIDPDYAIAIDTTHASTPDSKKGETLEMEKGVAIGIGPNMNRNITKSLLKIAEENDIPYQREVMGGCTGTNGWVIQTSREGVSTSVLSLPIKYMHTPVETMDIKDAEAIVNLVTLFAESVGEEL